jgi:alpha-tubulin suppressor-like RCC1 family protein
VLDPANTANALSGIASISAGTDHTCAVMVDRTARCFGLNSSGQLGNNLTPNAVLPASVVDPAATANALAGVSTISAGGSHTCAVMTDTTARCWGLNSSGQLGNSASAATKVPSTVTGLTGATSVSAGADHSCATMADRTARCWGKNSDGQLGYGTTIQSLSTPGTVKGASWFADLQGVVAISAGGTHSCATLTDGTARCWGFGRQWQLGNGKWYNSNPRQDISYSAVEVANPYAYNFDTGGYYAQSGFRGPIAVGTYGQTCAVLGDGVSCWGNDNTGQAGGHSNWFGYASEVWVDPVDLSL